MVAAHPSASVAEQGACPLASKNLVWKRVFVKITRRRRLDGLGDQAAIYELAFKEGVRALEDQARTLEQLRVRMAGLLASAVAPTVVFFEPVANARDSERDWLFWLLAGLGTLLLIAVFDRVRRGLRPRFEWRLSLSPRIIVEGYADDDPPASLAETYKELALRLDDNLKHNEGNLTCIQGWLQHALWLVPVELLVWVGLRVKIAW